MIDKNTIKALGLMMMRNDEVARLMTPTRMEIFDFDAVNNEIISEKVDAVKIVLELAITKTDYDKLFRGEE